MFISHVKRRDTFRAVHFSSHYFGDADKPVSITQALHSAKWNLRQSCLAKRDRESFAVPIYR
jgi:hypothetical protein